MRKTLTALLLAATLPTLAFAMPDGGPRHHDRDHGMFKELNLSKEQRQEFRRPIATSPSATWTSCRKPRNRP